MSGIDKTPPRFTRIYEDFAPKGSGDKDKHLRGTDDGKIFLREKFGDGSNGPSERAQGARIVYDSIVRDYGQDIAEQIFPGGRDNPLKRGDLPTIKQNIEKFLEERFEERGGQGKLLGTTQDLSGLVKDDYLPKDEQYRRDKEQFERDVSGLKNLRGSVSEDMISRMMKHVQDCSEAKAWGSLSLGLGKGLNLQHVAQLMPPEVRLNITQRTGPQTTEREMLKGVLTAIDSAKKGQGNDKELGDELYKFVQWVSENENHGFPEELVGAIVDFREMWAQNVSSPQRQMDRLGLPEDVQKPLREAFRLRGEWIDSYPGKPPSHPGERPSFIDISSKQYGDYDPQYEEDLRTNQEYEAYPELLASYPQRLKEWEDKEKLHNEIGGLFSAQLQKIPPNKDVPDWLLNQLTS